MENLSKVEGHIPLLIKGVLHCTEHNKVLFNLKPALVSVEDKNCLVKQQSSERQASFLTPECWTLDIYVPQLCRPVESPEVSDFFWAVPVALIGEPELSDLVCTLQFYYQACTDIKKPMEKKFIFQFGSTER